MYMEKLLIEPRHIEIQIIGDSKEEFVIYQKEIVQYRGVIKNY